MLILSPLSPPQAGIFKGCPLFTTPTYCAHRTFHDRQLNDALANDAYIAKLFESVWAEIGDDLGGRDLTDVLFEPVERVTHGYVDMLEQLLGATPEDHPDYEDVQQAIVVWQRLAELCLSQLAPPSVPAPPAPASDSSNTGDEGDDEDDEFDTSETFPGRANG